MVAIPMAPNPDQPEEELARCSGCGKVLPRERLVRCWNCKKLYCKDCMARGEQGLCLTCVEEEEETETDEYMW